MGYYFQNLATSNPINVVRPAPKGRPANIITDEVPDFVSFYHWHLLDPIVFQDALTATIQQIGALMIPHGEESRIDALSQKYTLAGHGWERNIRDAPFSAFTLAERRDGYCAAAFVYCRTPQSVPRVDVKVATADIGRRDYEVA